MAVRFDGLQRCQFGGIYFPVEEVSLIGTQRHHIHEFPHTPGGALEKLGRRPYIIRIVPVFDDGITTYTKDNGLPLYPDGLERLRLLYEEETTSSLTLPTLGTIQAFMTNFSQRMVASLRSGERCEFEFVEDQSSRFLLEDLVVVSTAGIQDQAKTLLDLSADAGMTDSILDKIQAAAGKVQALLGQADFYATLFEAKVLALVDLCAQADRIVSGFQDPLNHNVLEALKELWASSISLSENIAGKTSKISKYVTPKLMTIQDVSSAVYGTTTQSFDILQLNDVEDAFAIPAGVTMKYYETSAGSSLKQF